MQDEGRLPAAVSGEDFLPASRPAALLLCPHRALPQRVCVDTALGSPSSSRRDASATGQGPSLMASFAFVYLQIRSLWGFRFNVKFGGHIQSPAVLIFII